NRAGRTHVGRALESEKWRSIANVSGRSRLMAIGVHGRKCWQPGGMRSRAVGSVRGKNGALDPRKPPFLASFRLLFDDFLRVLLRTLPSRRELARMRPQKALVLNHARSPTYALRRCCPMPARSGQCAKCPQREVRWPSPVEHRDHVG